MIRVEEKLVKEVQKIALSFTLQIPTNVIGVIKCVMSAQIVGSNKYAFKNEIRQAE